jgi:alkylation response protein AidB-like acyl-CoA dehydrogenase
MVGECIARMGTDAQKNKYCPKLASGEFLAGAFALSEPHVGSDPAGLSTRAERRGNEWVLNGTKQWITSGAHAGVIVVWAKTDPSAGARGITAFLVERGTPGLIIGKHEDKMGIRASNTVALTFEDCALPADALLGEVGGGFKIGMTMLDGGRIGIASQSVGTMRAAIEASVRYARDRKAFGQSIGNFQAVQWMLADMETEYSSARLLALRAAWLKENGRPFTREASMAKVFASEAAQRVTS